MGRHKGEPIALDVLLLAGRGHHLLADEVDGHPEVPAAALLRLLQYALALHELPLLLLAQPCVRLYLKEIALVVDQSDFFEIESNAWLSKEEKGELMQRQRILEEAEERRRRDFRVTIDLVGKQVMAAPCEEENVEGNRLAFVTREPM